MSKSTKVHEFIEKHFRQIVGVLLLSIISFLLLYRLDTMPAGLNKAEIESAVISGQANFLRDIIDLPWHVWQGLFIRFFGLSVWSVRLPAAILAIAGVILLWRILIKMTDRTSALLGAIIATTSVLYIGMGRTGISNIATILLIELTVLFSLKAFNGQRGLMTAAACWGLLFFMDNGPVIALALLAVGLFHPRTRLWLVSDKARMLKAGVVSGAFILVFVGLAVIGLRAGRDLPFGSLGRPSVDNLAESLSSIFVSSDTSNYGLVTPYLSIIGLALMALGLVSVFRDCAFSLRSYLTVGLLILTIGLSFFNPAAGYLVFLPAAILLTITINELIMGWYGVFPHNPYARGFAVAPLVLLICSLCTTNASRYFAAINYNPDIAYRYDAGVPAVSDIADGSSDKYALVVSDSKAKVYELMQLDNVETMNEAPKQGKVIILGDGKVPGGFRLERVVTSGLSKDYAVAKVYSK